MRFATWDDFMAEQRRSGLLRRISDFVTMERRGHGEVVAEMPDCDVVAKYPVAVYPASADVMRFTTTPLRDVRVVILGQDPYHQPGQAHGLAFSVPSGVKTPPSLQNILIELADDLGMAALGQDICGRRGARRSGDLTPWTRQGVLLLNTALTVRHGEPGSHMEVWQPFTDEVVRAVVDSADVAPHFILWGSKAKAAFERCIGKLRIPLEHRERSENVYWVRHDSRYITATYSTHPSPLSADKGFFGSRPFSRANLALKLNNPGVDCQVDWRLP